MFENTRLNVFLNTYVLNKLYIELDNKIWLRKYN